MANNEIKPFATGANANVTPQGEWENLPALLTGFSSGKASSAQVNKAIRQASFVAATLAQFIADRSGEDVLDDGDQDGLLVKMLSAINKTSQPLDETLVALAALATSANKLPYFTGNDKAALTDLTATGRGMIGQNDITGVLSYLGLGEGSSLPVGIPVPWSLSTPPAGWLKCNGASFSASQYPKLALAYPSLKLPDLRGEFIRGWDDGREVDSGRALISNQGDAMRNIQARIDGIYRNNASGSPTGAFTMATQSTGVIAAGTAATTERIALFFDASNAGVPLATEIRPRNVAFNYIVRAA